MHLTIDVSGLRFADSASVRVLVIAARTLKERGGGLVLLRPQHGVARMLEITGADQMITVRGETEVTAETAVPAHDTKAERPTLFPDAEAIRRATDGPDAARTNGHSRSTTVAQVFVTSTYVSAGRAKGTIAVLPSWV